MTRKALVTGANRGIGLAIAQGLAAIDGIEVVLLCRNLDDAKEAGDKIGGGVAGCFAAELSDPIAVGDAAAAMLDELGTIDALVNNAGVLVNGDGLAISTIDFLRSMTVNLAAPFALINAIAPVMNAKGYGRIVNVSSGWGSFAEGFGGPFAYSVSKAALNALTVNMAPALKNNVKINACCPGWVRTDMGGAAATRSPEQGADTPIWLSTLPDDGPNGGFFRDRQPIAW